MIQASFRRGQVTALGTRINDVLDQVERRGMKDALNKSATPIVKRAKATAPKRTGALKKSIGKKARTDPATQSATVRVGVRRGEFNGERPSQYAHLVEFGHQQVTADGKTVGFVSPNPFMRPAYDAEKHKAPRIFAEHITADLVRQFGRAKKAGKL